jgi:S-(hydroxymethyl)glutathione dehydrogenase/alcohol dehydrogenase
MGHYADNQVSLNLFELTLLQKRVQGAIFGGTGPRTMIPELLDEYRSRQLKLTELITPYRLEDINQGYQDMRDGKNLRGVIRYSDADY